jgi:hypothetical protein
MLCEEIDNMRRVIGFEPNAGEDELSGHALIFPSFTNLHRGLPVESGDRYLLVFWLYDRKRAIHLYEEVVE